MKVLPKSPTSLRRLWDKVGNFIFDEAPEQNAEAEIAEWCDDGSCNYEMADDKYSFEKRKRKYVKAFPNEKETGKINNGKISKTRSSRSSIQPHSCNEENYAGSIFQNNLASCSYSFEAVPDSEPWYPVFKRQNEGSEIIFPTISDRSNQPFLLPYEITSTKWPVKNKREVSQTQPLRRSARLASTSAEYREAFKKEESNKVPSKTKPYKIPRLKLSAERTKEVSQSQSLRRSGRLASNSAEYREAVKKEESNEVPRKTKPYKIPRLKLSAERTKEVSQSQSLRRSARLATTSAGYRRTVKKEEGNILPIQPLCNSNQLFHLSYETPRLNLSDKGTKEVSESQLLSGLAGLSTTEYRPSPKKDDQSSEVPDEPLFLDIQDDIDFDFDMLDPF